MTSSSRNVLADGVVRPWRIGRLTLTNPLVLAPMAGVTDPPFRFLVKEQGCALVYTAMVSDRGLLFDNARTQELLTVWPGEEPVAAQLFGAEPEAMAEAARRVAATGSVALIDINMGCPTPKIVKGGAGSALLRDPARAVAIVAAVRAAVALPVTVKLRTGWDAEHINILEMAERLVAAGAAALAVHGRTREQFYSGQADWGLIRAVAKAVPVPVIGNGDIATPEEARRRLEESGCAAVMIGRGALGNPWLFRRTLHYLKTGELLPEPTGEERLAMARRHLELLCRYHGEERGVREMRKHLGWYVRGLAGAARFRQATQKLVTQAEVVAALQGFVRGE